MSDESSEGFLERWRFLLECVILSAKENAPDPQTPTKSKTLAEMEEECADQIKADLADRLGVDKQLMDDVKPPSEQ